MGMSINASWDEEFSRTVNNLGCFMSDRGRYFSNFSAFNKNISLLSHIGVDNSCIFEEIALVKPNWIQK
jgi:hypothetical protein